MNDNQNVATPIRSKKRSGILLYVYDFLIVAFACLLFLFIYKGMQDITIKWGIIHSLYYYICIIIGRFVLKVHEQVWRYGGIQCYVRLIVGDVIGFLIYTVSSYILSTILGTQFLRIQTIRVFSIFSAILLGSLAIRMVYRLAYKMGTKKNAFGKILRFLLKVFAGGRVSVVAEDTSKIRIAIVGAGRVGITLAEELLGNPAAQYIPILFIDTDPTKKGKIIHDIPVYGESEATLDAIKECKIQEIVFAVPQLSADEKKKLYEYYKISGCRMKTYDYPNMQTANGKRHLREFDIEELLFREPIQISNEKTQEYFTGKTVLVTGGGGSIGSEIGRQLAKMNVKKLILLDVNENGVYDVQQQLKIKYKDVLDVCVEILSVTNIDALERVFKTYYPDVVVHAAAHKHVPLMEHNCIEAVENNVFGTLNTVELSEKYKVSRFMMVSTDKAVNPTNVMGATKRMCEMIVQSHSASSHFTTFSATRFGNVLGSAGSVIPLFKRQIAAGGPVTLTDMRIIRYFMTIPEASQLVLESASMANNGELFVLDMGKPIKILELAENMIQLAGFEPYKDIDIIETGLRPGEKLYEELLVKSETLSSTDNQLIFIEKDKPITAMELDEKLRILKESIETGDDDKVRSALRRVVPTFKPNTIVNKQAEKSEEMKMA